MAEEPKAQDRFVKDVRPLLERYCADCHMNDEAEAGIAFDRYEDQAAALKDGRTFRLKGSNDIDSGNRGIFLVLRC